MNLCVCGHDPGVHQHHRPGTDCGRCTCRSYRRRRWWHKPPAGGEDPAETPRNAPDSPLPGLTWIYHITSRTAACGCTEHIDHLRRTRLRHRCDRHAFAAEMEARMRL